MSWKRQAFIVVGASALTAFTIGAAASAHAPSGAIFTTLADGSEVNQNLFANKEDVYLDGGPGPGAPQGAAGLDDGTYVFQVTNPNGQTLLSTDAAKCRQFVVTDGVISGVVATGCEHLTGDDVDHPPAQTVQLLPFDNTPNPGGEYKVWVVRLEDFLLGCQELGKPGASGLDLVDCGDAPANHHGFIPSHSKTDNFKVRRSDVISEIDAIFYADANGNGAYDWNQESQLSGLHMLWTDTVGVKNIKHSYFVEFWNKTEAHAEAVEQGTHYVTIPDLSALGCDVGEIYVNDVNHYLPTDGPQTIKVDIAKKTGAVKDLTVQIWVACS
jgi:hypothetical protein